MICQNLFSFKLFIKYWYFYFEKFIPVFGKTSTVLRIKCTKIIHTRAWLNTADKDLCSARVDTLFDEKKIINVHALNEAHKNSKKRENSHYFPLTYEYFQSFRPFPSSTLLSEQLKLFWFFTLRWKCLSQWNVILQARSITPLQ